MLIEVCTEFPETKQFINEHVEQKRIKENIGRRGNSFFFDKPRSKELA